MPDVIQTAEGSNARMVGIRLAELGDQIDAMYGDELDDIVKLAGSPDEAFSSFSAVIRNVFDWNENGIREQLIVIAVHEWRETERMTKREREREREREPCAHFYATICLNTFHTRDVEESGMKRLLKFQAKLVHLRKPEWTLQ